MIMTALEALESTKMNIKILEEKEKNMIFEMINFACEGGLDEVTIDKAITDQNYSLLKSLGYDVVITQFDSTEISWRNAEKNAKKKNKKS